MVDWRVWVQAGRPLSQVNLLAPLLCGQALAFALLGFFDWWVVGLLLLYGVLQQLYIVFLNDYADLEADRHNDGATSFSGGSRVLVEGRLAPRALWRVGVGCGVGVMGIGCFAAFFWGLVWAPVLVGVGLGLMWAYSFAPLRLNYRGGGEVLQGVGCGVVLPLVGYYFQAGSLAAFPWGMLVPLGVLFTASSVATSLPDAAADRLAGKRTLAAVWGVERAGAGLVAGGMGGVIGHWLLAGGPATPWPEVTALGLLVYGGLQLPRIGKKPGLLRLSVAGAGAAVGYAAAFGLCFWPEWS